LLLICHLCFLDYHWIIDANMHLILWQSPGLSFPHEQLYFQNQGFIETVSLVEASTMMGVFALSPFILIKKYAIPFILCSTVLMWPIPFILCSDHFLNLAFLGWSNHSRISRKRPLVWLPTNYYYLFIYGSTYYLCVYLYFHKDK
jgi:hypothetical protein